MTYTSSVSCACGATYGRAEVRLPIKDVGMFECRQCGEILERWHGRLVPTFELLSLPQRREPNAA